MAHTELLLGKRYQLVSRIAVGGMGEVWRATDLVLGRAVAVKLLRSGHAGSQDDRARFRAEARHAGSLSHPGIAQVYDYRDDNEPYPPYLVMELVDGPSLARLLDEGPVDPARTMDLIAQTAAALQAAHAAGLVHRDIKPGNLLVTHDGQVKITDFGIAHEAGSASVTGSGVLIGTAAYLAPERATGAPATPAADLYALGIVAYQCLTGRLPFEGEPLTVALAHVERALPPLPPHVPAAVAALVADLTAKDPQARSAGAGVVAERAGQLRDALAGTAADPPDHPTLALALPWGTETPAGPRAGGRGQDGTRQRGEPRHRVLAGLSAVLAVAVIAVIAAASLVIAGRHKPAFVPPSPTQHPVSAASHRMHRAAPARRTGSATAVDTPVQTRQPVASLSSPAPSATKTPSPTPTRTSTPSATPSPTRTSSPTGTPTQTQARTAGTSPSSNPAYVLTRQGT